MSGHFVETLESLEDGAAVEEYGVLLAELIQAVQKEEGPGTLTITLKATLDEDGSILLSDKVKTAKPRKVKASRYMVGPGGVLRAQQLSFPVEGVGGAS